MTTLELSLIGTILVAVTVGIHGVGSHYWGRFLIRRFAAHDGYWRPHETLTAVILTAVVLLLLHVLEVVLWAGTYLALPGIDNLDSFEKALYFSMVTFTTLGYGDITLAPEWRLLSGIEAMNGIVLFGWSTAMLFAVVQRSYKVGHVKKK